MDEGWTSPYTFRTNCDDVHSVMWIKPKPISDRNVLRWNAIHIVASKHIWKIMLQIVVCTHFPRIQSILSLTSNRDIIKYWMCFRQKLPNNRETQPSSLLSIIFSQNIVHLVNNSVFSSINGMGWHGIKSHINTYYHIWMLPHILHRFIPFIHSHNTYTIHSFWIQPLIFVREWIDNKNFIEMKWNDYFLYACMNKWSQRSYSFMTQWPHWENKLRINDWNCMFDVRGIL